MPFKNLASPRKITDLGAEIRSSALLVNPGLVAMISSGPTRIAVQPISGSGGKITNVSLDGAEEVALLTRDVALVRGSDDAVWALLDITHTPKMDQVGRDMRALCMRPSGESALGLGWDGSATNFTLNRHEVDARPFSLRGNLRAADLTETETYAVVDGPDGGQLRIHPGATPEPGAMTRTSLPSEAAKFDRVRGGLKLSAVYKRGSQIVCLVVGGPNRPTAKLVQLEAKVTDVAVLDTSLFATYADGRVALYDSEAIAAASDAGPVEPKASITLNVAGEPRAALASAKGGATLWVGTSAGAVVSLSIVRKQAQ